MEWRSEIREHGPLAEVRFTITDVGRDAVPGILVHRPDAAGPQPLVLIAHPLTGSKDDYFVRDVAIAWAGRHGWACAGIDAPYHGDRVEYDPLSVLRDAERFQAVAREFAFDITAAVDAIAAHACIDPGRLGYVGYSFGSMLGIPAVAADGRFRAAAFCLIGEGRMLGPAAASGSPVQRLGNVAVRVVAKTRDEYFPREAVEGLVAALPGAKDLVWSPGGHFEIGDDVIRSAEQWLVAKL